MSAYQILSLLSSRLEHQQPGQSLQQDALLVVAEMEWQSVISHTNALIEIHTE